MRFPQLIIAGWRSGECEQALYVYVDDEAEPRKATKFLSPDTTNIARKPDLIRKQKAPVCGWRSDTQLF